MKKAICLMLAAALVASLVPALMLTASAATDEFPMIESAPKNVCWPEGTMAAYQCVCSNDKGHEKFSYNWFITFDGKEYPIGLGSKTTDPWRKYVDFSGGMTGRSSVRITSCAVVSNRFPSSPPGWNCAKS